MKKILFIFLIALFSFEIVLAKDEILQFRGGGTFPNVKEDLKKPETVIKIDEDFLKFNPLKSITQLNQSDQALEKLVGKTKFNENFQFRGGGKSIYSSYADSVFLIYVPDKKDKNKAFFGSGALVRTNGNVSLVVTNLHVVQDNIDGNILVIAKPKSLDQKYGEKYSGKVVAQDKKTDIAILKVIGLPNIKVIPTGSYKEIKVQDEVHAIGHPEGLNWTYTKGFVSAIRTNFTWNEHNATVIQHQIPISQGNSGGPLFNDDGKLVGINTAKKEKGQNLNFAVAIDEIEKVLRNKDNHSKEQPSKSNIISKRFPDAVGEKDSKKNGVIDTWYFDKNKNGIIDQIWVDRNQDGKIDVIYFMDENTKKVTSGIFDEKDSRVTVIYKDNKPSRLGYDYNKDGVIDRWETL
jgi:S1-C subfamily serine protease